MKFNYWKNNRYYKRIITNGFIMICCIFSFFVFCNLCLAETEKSMEFNFHGNNLIVSRFSSLQGLSDDYVTTIYQDSIGFLWIGTSNGLNRYDGYKFEVYKHDSNDISTISTNFIHSICEDLNGDIWVGSEVGLNRYNRVNNSFERYELSNSRAVLSIVTDGKNNIWAGTTDGIVRIDEKGQKFRIDKDISDNSIDCVNVICRGRNGALFAGNSSGQIFRCDDGNSFFEIMNLRNVIYDIYEDKSGLIWIATANGVYELNLIDNSRNLHVILSDKGKPYACKSIFEDQFGILWMGTEDKLAMLDKKKNTISFASNDNIGETFDKFGGVRAIYEDCSGNIWIGSRKQGIFRLKRSRFEHYTLGKMNYLNDSQVFNFFEDKNESLWIATLSGIVKLKKEKSGLYSHRFEEVFRVYARAICSDGDGNMWFGGEKLYKYRDGNITTYSMEGGNIRNIFFDSDTNTLLIGTLGCGMYEFDPVSEKVINSYKYPFRGDKDIYAISKDKYGFIWIGTFGDGVYKLNRKTDICEVYNKTNSKISDDYITSIHQDEKEQDFFWIGTWNGGLNRINTLTGEVDVFSEKKELLSNRIEALSEDDDNNIWISTGRGLVKYNRKENQFYVYDYSDGLQANEFNVGAALKRKDGRLIFGGINGLNVVYKSSGKNTKSKVKLIGFKKFDKPVFFNEPVSDIKEITLSSEDKFFSFEFSNLDFSNIEKTKYAYMLEGFDQDWVSSGHRNYASYTNLDPGTYKLKVKATNEDGVFDNDESRYLIVKINKEPPFYKTFIAYIFYLIGVFLVGRLLKHIWVNRESSLIVAGMSHCINTPLAKIKAGSQQLEVINKDLVGFVMECKELSIKELNFLNLMLIEIKENRNLIYTVEEEEHYKEQLIIYLNEQNIISSDKIADMMVKIKLLQIKQVEKFLPLLKKNNVYVLMKAISEFALLNIYATEIVSSVNEVSKVVDQLKQQLKQNILSNANMMNKERQLVDIVRNMDEVISSLRGIRSDITFIKQYSSESIGVFGNADDLSKVWRNLIENAFDALPEGGTIKISIYRDRSSVKIDIEDDGEGIDKEDINKIFKKGFSTKENGTGHGLPWCRRLIKEHKGKINVISENGITKFTVCLPVGSK